MHKAGYCGISVAEPSHNTIVRTGVQTASDVTHPRQLTFVAQSRTELFNGYVRFMFSWLVE